MNLLLPCPLRPLCSASGRIRPLCGTRAAKLGSTRTLSTTSSSTLTPSEAGRRAAKLAAKRTTIETNHQMDTVLAHAGVDDHNQQHHDNRPMAPPLHVATTYTRPPDGDYRATDSVYSRMDNPTRLLLEQEMARLEGHGIFFSNADQPRSFAFCSGMMAVSGLILAHQAPLTVLLPTDLYHGTSTVMWDVFTRFGVTVERVDWRNLDTAAQQVVTNIPSDHNVIVWLETPSNPLCHIIDIQAVCTWARTHVSTQQPPTIVVDSTLAPPPIQQPLCADVDVVMHSATKYLAGHSDALIGTLTTNPTSVQGQHLATRLAQVQVMTGGVASTWDAWLCLRGLRTLAVRVRQQCQTAQQVAEYLEQRNGVTVHYPGLPSHPQHDIAQSQMKNGLYGGVLSVDMGSETRAVALAAALQTIQRATSLGGTETLIEHRASIEPPGRVTSPPGLLRMSVGLEDVDDLIADLQQALEIAEHIVQ